MTNRKAAWAKLETSTVQAALDAAMAKAGVEGTVKVLYRTDRTDPYADLAGFDVVAVPAALLPRVMGWLETYCERAAEGISAANGGSYTQDNGRTTVRVLRVAENRVQFARYFQD